MPEVFFKRFFKGSFDFDSWILWEVWHWLILGILPNAVRPFSFRANVMWCLVAHVNVVWLWHSINDTWRENTTGTLNKYLDATCKFIQNIYLKKQVEANWRNRAKSKQENQSSATHWESYKYLRNRCNQLCRNPKRERIFWFIMFTTEGKHKSISKK